MDYPLMDFARNLSIRNKLLVIILGTTFFALAIGFLVMIVYDVRTFRHEMVDQALATARVVGGYTVSELAFRDAAEASRTLGALSSIPDLEGAALYDTEGVLFADYTRSGGEPVQLPFRRAGYLFDWDHLHVVLPVMHQGERYGTLHLAISTQTLHDKIRHYLTVVLLVGLGLAGITVVGALRLQRVVSAPILRLAEAAREVSQSGEYSTRVTKAGHDEVGALYDAWNEMLGQIEQRQQEQARVEAALRRSEERFRAIIEQSNDAIYVLRPDNRFSYVNPKFCALLEHSLEEVTADGFDNIALVAPPSREFIKREREKRASGEGALTQYEFQCLSRSGRVYDFEVNTTEIEWGNEPARMGIMRDITARKRAEERLQEQQSELQRHAEELEQSNRELDQFAYVVSHDLRAPLRAIANLSTWIEDDLSDVLTGESRDQMDLLRRRVQRMESLINGILEYSRLGRMRSSVESVSVRALIRDVVEDLAPPATFSIHVGEGMPTIAAERVRLAQVFGNLIGNAIKHHPRQDGRVEISVEDLGDAFEFAVSDDGQGIAPEYHERIFVMFQTLQPRDRHESTGVGLAIVKRIVEDQGGRMSVESREGQGATFRFTWPKLEEGV